MGSGKAEGGSTLRPAHIYMVAAAGRQQVPVRLGEFSPAPPELGFKDRYGVPAVVATVGSLGRFVLEWLGGKHDWCMLQQRSSASRGGAVVPRGTKYVYEAVPPRIIARGHHPRHYRTYSTTPRRIRVFKISGVKQLSYHRIYHIILRRIASQLERR